MNTRQYTYLLAIAQYGCISHAAEKLCISQAALSKFLIEQENLLGVKLFLRYKKRLYPTPSGKIYLDAAQKIISAKNTTLHAINRLSGSSSATPIRLGFTPGRGADLSSKVYSRFSYAFPTVNLELSEFFSNKQEEQIHNRNLDFAFGTSIHTRYDDVCNLPISRMELFLAVPAFHPLAKFASNDLNNPVSMPLIAFRDTPFVLPSPIHNVRIIAEDLFQQAGFTPKITFESNNDMTVEAMIFRGIGIGFMSRLFLKPAPELAYFRLDPPAYEIRYIRYAKEHSFTDVERYLLGIVAEERLKEKGSILIHSPEIDSFIHQLSQPIQTGVYNG